MKIQQKHYRSLLSLFGLAAFLSDPIAASSAPNILLIIADDLGADVCVHKTGGTTPEFWIENGGADAASGGESHKLAGLSLLAQKGVTFTSAWAYPSCAPTRSAAFSGKHAFDTGISYPNSSYWGAGTTTIATTLETVADAYQNGTFGKWHLGENSDADGKLTTLNSPVNSGWHRHTGTLSAGSPSPNYNDWTKYTSVEIPDDGSYYDEPAATAVYSTHAIYEDALAFIQENHNVPWFVTLQLHAPHDPWTTSDLPPSFDGETRYSNSSPTTTNQVYHAQVQDLDYVIQTLIEDLKSVDNPNDASDTATNELRQTLIVFVGDNGTPGGIIPFTANDSQGAKMDLFEGGVHVPMIVADGSRINAGGLASVHSSLIGTSYDGFVHVIDLFATLGKYGGKSSSSLTAESPNSYSFTSFLRTGDTTKLPGRDYNFSQQKPNGSDATISAIAMDFQVGEGTAAETKRYKLIHDGNAADTALNLGYTLYDVSAGESVDLLTEGGLTNDEKVIWQALYDRLVSAGLKHLDSPGGSAVDFPDPSSLTASGT